MKQRCLFMLLITAMLFSMLGGAVMAASTANEPLVSGTSDMEGEWNAVAANWGTGFYPTVINSSTAPVHGGNTPSAITNEMKQRSFFSYPVPFTKEKTGIADDEEFNAIKEKIGVSEEELSPNGILGHSSTALALKIVPDAEAAAVEKFASSQPYVMMVQDLGYFREIDDPATRKLRYGFDIYKPDDGGAFSIETKFGSAFATADVTSSVFSLGSNYALDKGRWNRVDLMVDCSTNTGNIYINNKLVKEN